MYFVVVRLNIAVKWPGPGGTSPYSFTEHHGGIRPDARSPYTLIFVPSIPGFEPTIPAGERPQIYALERAATGTGYHLQSYFNITCYLYLVYSRQTLRILRFLYENV